MDQTVVQFMEQVASEVILKKVILTIIQLVMDLKVMPLEYTIMSVL